VRNSSLVHRLLDAILRRKSSGAKSITEAMDPMFTSDGRGAFLSALKSHRKVRWSVRKWKCWHE